MDKQEQVMSAHENLSDQFVTVYRGRTHYDRYKIPKNQESLKGLGMHWTTDIDVARHFAGGWNLSDWPSDHRTGKKATEMGGHVLYGKVNKEHVIKPNTPEWNRIATQHSVMEPEDNHEKEQTLREGAPIQITGVERVRNKPKVNENTPNKFIINKLKFKGGMGTV